MLPYSVNNVFQKNNTRSLIGRSKVKKAKEKAGEFSSLM